MLFLKLWFTCVSGVDEIQVHKSFCQCLGLENSDQGVGVRRPTVASHEKEHEQGVGFGLSSSLSPASPVLSDTLLAPDCTRLFLASFQLPPLNALLEGFPVK